jgi:geranyl-CoA carboxylase alpha subunit
MSFSSLLIANRSEIAMRILMAARARGLRTIAVFSDADAGAPFVAAADEAVRIGPGPAADSYLRIETILDAARRTGAEAVHPGYGFLSENAAFARAVEAAGLVFVGPTPEAIEAMGDKARAKRLLRAAGAPCAPGYEGEDQSEKAFLDAARAIGFPVMLKAAAGGGGRGMRLVHERKELPRALALARAEAEAAFGDGRMILERALIGARHVEIQILADAFGDIVHLGERDCSVQRRHQKLFEEAPAPGVTPALREALGEAAIAIARAVSYRGAGTVEFMLEPSGAFYFLEMNTRLQVEHPVTELICGRDIVDLQLQIAAGEPLGFCQEDVTFSGAAIEARLCAEDPGAEFLPSPGKILLWSPPQGPGVRVDTGIETGFAIPPFYDSLAAKIIAHGATREEARARLALALKDTVLLGPRTNRDFLRAALETPRFRQGGATTRFLAEAFGAEGYRPDPINAPALAVAAALRQRLSRDAAHAAAPGVSAELLDWGSAGALASVHAFTVDAAEVIVRIETIDRDCWRVCLPDAQFTIALLQFAPPRARLEIDGRRADAAFVLDGPALHIDLGDHAFVVRTAAAAAGQSAEPDGRMLAPMHGRVTELRVGAGETVSAGDAIAVLEAMKLHHVLAAPIDGLVEVLHVAPGAQVTLDQPIAIIRPRIKDKDPAP